MATKLEHCVKYENNEKFMQLENLKDNFKDWYITGAFYCSVHLIEGYLHKFKSKDTNNHVERMKVVREDSFLKTIFSDYSTIYHESIQARYYNKQFTDDDVKVIDEKLKKIKSKIGPTVQ